MVTRATVRDRGSAMTSAVGAAAAAAITTSAATRTIPCQSGRGSGHITGEIGIAADVRRKGQGERDSQEDEGARRPPVADEQPDEAAEQRQVEHRV